ncbi:MAG TPA: PAS domain S-box protein [Xanthobacteraceae bacterium]|nr:PAS domain S-box protein [Xanthobacteraceae bacterium]
MSHQRERILSRLPNSSLSPCQLLPHPRPDETASILASIVESADDGIYSITLDGIITHWNRGAERLFGYTPDETVGNRHIMLLPVDRQDEEITILERIKHGERIHHYETVRQRKDGSLVDISLTVSPIATPEGSIIGAVKIARDISEHKKSQQLIIRELNHRTQNLFAVAQTIAARAVDESKTFAEIKYVLNDRLQTLARAYRLIAEEGSASLAAILEREFDAFPKQVKISGCDIVVNPSAAQQLALIIHELATNALKYGALSAPAGRVAIEGQTDRLNGSGTFTFIWRETGGPAVTKPIRRGFGSVILLDSARHFGESVDLDYSPRGLSYKLQVRLNTIEASNK